MKEYILQLQTNIPKGGWMYGCFICGAITARIQPLNHDIFIEFKKKNIIRISKSIYRV